MLPCQADGEHEASSEEENHHRRLLWFERRFLAAASPVECRKVNFYGACTLLAEFCLSGKRFIES